MKKTLLFTDKDADTLSFLDSCGRKQTTITILALKEFISKYQLADKSPKEIKSFLNSYEYIKAATNAITNSFYQGVREERNDNKPVSSESKEQEDIKNSINKMAALFGA